jgi:hypothetical protein
MSAPTKSSVNQLQYGRETFVDSSEFLRKLRSAPSPGSRLRCLADGKGLAASIRLFRRLPRVTLSLSSSPSGREIAEHLRRTRLGIPPNRLAQGILVVPPTQKEYLRGRSRQAVRTNVRRAEELGLSCRRLTNSSEFQYAADYMIEHRSQTDEQVEIYRRLIDHPDARYWSVEASDRTPAGLAVLNVDSQAAMLWSLVCLEQDAKWLLHTHIVGELGAAGVPYLLTSSVMAPIMRERDQYFQKLLGYQIAHLSLS